MDGLFGIRPKTGCSGFEDEYPMRRIGYRPRDYFSLA